MNNKDLIKLFDNYFEGKINNNVFNKAKTELVNVMSVDNLTEDNENLQNFVKHLSLIRKRVEYAIDYLNGLVLREDLKVIKKLIYKNRLKVFRKIYQNIGKFEIEFMNQKGISLVRVEDNIFYHRKGKETI